MLNQLRSLCHLKLAPHPAPSSRARDLTGPQADSIAAVAREPAGGHCPMEGWTSRRESTKAFCLPNAAQAIGAERVQLDATGAVP